mmetsp:Transcript_3686/g.11462  ORF Transcript_3686/g.11462 Transcript_3686/m.11462 type:complete len:277 (-) Transcript_3686:37-867(-)
MFASPRVANSLLRHALKRSSQASSRLLAPGTLSARLSYSASTGSASSASLVNGSVFDRPASVHSLLQQEFQRAQLDTIHVRSFSASSRLFASSNTTPSSAPGGDKTGRGIAKQEKKEPNQGLVIARKVTHVAKESSYYLVFVAGGVLVIVVLYTILKDSLDPNSPTRLYSKALSTVKEDRDVQRFIGEPIKGYAERSGRGRHQDVAHQFYWGRDNLQCIRMRFYLSGSRNRGDVFCDMCKESDGWQYQNLVVSVPDVERVIHVVHDKHELSSEGVL